MPDTGFVFAGTGSVIDPPGTDYAWTGEGNITADDGTNATANMSGLFGGAVTKYLRASNFNFAAIPDGSTIDGIELKVEWSGGVSPYPFEQTVQLVNASSALVGVNKADGASFVGSTPTVKTFGGAADTWSASPTAAMVKNSNFGAYIRLSNVGTFGFSDSAAVDYVAIKVYYTPPATANRLLNLRRRSMAC